MINNKRRKNQARLCPRCRKKNLIIIDVLKKNWPFGKKSKPAIIIKKRKKVCTNCYYREIRAGVISSNA